MRCRCNVQERTSGRGARSLLAGLRIEAMAQARPLEVRDLRRVGSDLRLLLRPAAA